MSDPVQPPQARGESDVPLRGKPTGNFCWQQNELHVAFQPIIGAAAHDLYCHLTGKAYGATFSYTLTALANETGRARATIWRALAVLEEIGLVRTSAGGGNQPSKCSLVDLAKLAISLGAVYDRKAASYVFTESLEEQLRSRVAALLAPMQSKAKGSEQAQTKREKRAHQNNGSDPFLTGKKRDSICNPERCHQLFEETRAGFYLLQQNAKLENIISPNSQHRESETPKSKDSPDKDEPDGLLRWAVVKFTGVMDGMRAHILETNRPPDPRYTNGAADWKEFGFGSLAVDAAARDGESLVLTLGAADPAAARRGLKKYCRRWEVLLLEWYGCHVRYEIQRTARTWLTTE